jgi:mono/diheme cytochrome c family protein
MKLFVTGLVVGIITFPLAFYFYFATGGAPVATAEAAMPFEKTLAHKALNARIRKGMPMNAPIQGDEPNLTAGAKIYREHCAVCHGVPRQHETAIATGMYPGPPKLLEGKGVTDDEPGGELLESRARDSPDWHAGIRQVALRNGDVASKFPGSAG